MSRTTPIPVTATPEAAARVAELGIQRELQKMLEHAQMTIPGLCSIEVQLALPYDTDDETSITIKATRDKPDAVMNETWKHWRDWVISSYPPEVWWSPQPRIL